MSSSHSHLGHAHFWARPITRRTFLGSAALAGGAAATAGALLPQLARADFDGVASVLPRPIGIGVAPFGIPIHHFPPVPLLGPGPINEPSQVTDFNGMVGVCRVKGVGTGTDMASGATTRLTYQVDNGFMDGLYVGEDGNDHHGTFAFVWMDLFTGAVGTGQVHDFNPGIRESGLFWTQPVAGDRVTFSLESGTATLAVDDLDEEDYHNLHNALVDGPSDPASVSFEMRWKAMAEPMKVTDSVHRFTGRFSLSEVQIEWSATTPTFRFVSDPASSTHNVRSVIGRERNGVFFDE